MNQNPWHVENMAQYERERIRQEMGQIRLGERVSKPKVRGPRPIARLWHLVRRWFATQQKRQDEAVRRQPAGTTNANRQIRI